MVEFSLRPMEPSDGPAIDALMRNEAQTTSMAITTRYHVDVYEALLAQHPSLFGVVATSRGTEGLVGVATAFLDQVNVGGDPYPCAHLENLKVRHDVRRLGLGGRLAAWRIDEARRRFDGDGVIATGVEAGNSASLATAGRWATQVLRPLRVLIARVASKPPRRRTVGIRPLQSEDTESVVDGVNAYYRDHELYPPQSALGLTSFLAPTSLGEPIRHYRVAVAGDGTIVAGAAVTERFKLMTDHVDSIPLPLDLLTRIVPLFPRDHVIRSIELNLAWHAPGQVAAGRQLWDAIRHEWRDRASHVSATVDPRGSLMEMLHVGPTLAPTIRVKVPVQSPVRIDEERLVYSPDR
jgi:predicted N-acetyltransferase YhbS